MLYFLFAFLLNDASPELCGESQTVLQIECQVLCNDDNRAGWQGGLHRLRDSDNPIQTLEAWRRCELQNDLVNSTRSLSIFDC
jgi:hypothetical protein